MKNILFSVLALLFFSCASSNQSGILKVAEFNEKIKAQGSTIIDVRSPEEFNKGYIKGALNIDYNGSDFDGEIAKLDKEGTYYLYCRSGKRSGNALDKMKKSGFKNVFGLDGGIVAWEAEQLPVEKAGAIKNPADSASTETKDPTDFKTAIYGDKLVFVDFNATWCGPCRKMQPFVDMLKEERAKDVIVFSIDTDKETALAQEYQIQNLPTVLCIKKGAVLYRQEGYHDQQSLNDLINKYK